LLPKAVMDIVINSSVTWLEVQQTSGHPPFRHIATEARRM